MSKDGSSTSSTTRIGGRIGATPGAQLPGEETHAKQDRHRGGDLHERQPRQPVRVAAQQPRADGAACRDADQHPRECHREGIGRGVERLRHQAEPDDLQRERREAGDGHHPPHRSGPADRRRGGRIPACARSVIDDVRPGSAGRARSRTRRRLRCIAAAEQERPANAERADQEETGEQRPGHRSGGVHGVQRADACRKERAADHR